MGDLSRPTPQLCLTRGSIPFLLRGWDRMSTDSALLGSDADEAPMKPVVGDQGAQTTRCDLVLFLHADSLNPNVNAEH